MFVCELHSIRTPPARTEFAYALLIGLHLRSRGHPEQHSWATGGSSLAITELPVPGAGLSHRGLAAVAEQDEVRLRPCERALDWFAFFISAVQAGFGPFMAVYLTEHAWPQHDIGLVLTISGLVALAAQMPGGALVDAISERRLLAGLAVVANAASALMLAMSSSFSMAMTSYILLAALTAVLGPAIVAISLGLVGHGSLGERLGRNARFAAFGNGFAAATMGACGHFFSTRAVFFLTAALALPALMALPLIRGKSLRPAERVVERPPSSPSGLKQLVANRTMLVFIGGIVLFQLANVALLPLLGGIMVHRSSQWATMSVAGGMVVPQLVVTVISPWVGLQASGPGRRPLLLACFAALSLRAALFAFLNSPPEIIAVQALDGISAAVVGVMFPLVIVDLARKSGHVNLALGMAGTAVGIGASLSTTLGGYLADHFGTSDAFLALAAIAAGGLVLLWACMPETRLRAAPGAPVIHAN
jgi:MFS family permease